MQPPWRKWFARERSRARRLINDQADRIEGARGPLARVWDDLHTSARLVRSWGRRDYVGVGRGTIVLLVGALLYFVSPIDAIVDAIPVLGFVDDAAVLTWVVGQVRAELEAFRAWEAIRLEPGASASSEVIASGLVVSPKG